MSLMQRKDVGDIGMAIIMLTFVRCISYIIYNNKLYN